MDGGRGHVTSDRSMATTKKRVDAQMAPAGHVTCHCIQLAVPRSGDVTSSFAYSCWREWHWYMYIVLFVGSCVSSFVIIGGRRRLSDNACVTHSLSAASAVTMDAVDSH